MKKTAILVLAICACVFAVGKVTIPQRGTAGAVITASKYNENLDTLASAHNTLVDTVNVMPRWLNLLRGDSTFRKINVDSIRSNPDVDSMQIDFIRGNPNIDSIAGDVKFSGSPTIAGSLTVDTLAGATVTIPGQLIVDTINSNIVVGNINTGTNDISTDSINARAIKVTGNFDFGGKVTVDTVRATGAAGLHIQDDGGSGIFVKDGGNVGIGDATPDAQLTVGSSDQTVSLPGQLLVQTATAATAPSRLVLHGNQPAATPTVPAEILVYGQGYTGASTLAAKIGVVTSQGDASSNINGSLTFSTSNNATSTTEAVRITAAGNVGIGDTTPDAKLDVAGGAIMDSIQLGTGTWLKTYQEGTFACSLFDGATFRDSGMAGYTRIGDLVTIRFPYINGEVSTGFGVTGIPSALVPADVFGAPIIADTVDAGNTSYPRLKMFYYVGGASIKNADFTEFTGTKLGLTPKSSITYRIKMN